MAFFLCSVFPHHPPVTEFSKFLRRWCTDQKNSLSASLAAQLGVLASQQAPPWKLIAENLDIFFLWPLARPMKFKAVDSLCVTPTWRVGFESRWVGGFGLLAARWGNTKTEGTRSPRQVPPLVHEFDFEFTAHLFACRVFWGII